MCHRCVRLIQVTLALACLFVKVIKSEGSDRNTAEVKVDVNCCDLLRNTWESCVRGGEEERRRERGGRERVRERGVKERERESRGRMFESISSVH